MIFGSVCTGIGAAERAWLPLGWKAAFISEIAAFPRAVLKHHHPNIPLHGDFTTIQDGDYDPIDLLVGGTPCQSFSIAGLRGGMGDDRGNLALEYLKLAKRLRPRWLAWENVPGVFSSLSHSAPDQRPPDIDLDGDHGPGDGEEVVVVDEYEADESHAFSCILAGFSELGYGLAYRTLDAQFTRTRQFPWAVPQRRRRVFVVGYLGDWRRAPAVLFERESLSGHPPPRREAGQGIAGTVAGGARQCGGFSCDDISQTLNAGGHSRNPLDEPLIGFQATGDAFWREGLGPLAASDDNGSNQLVVSRAFSIQAGALRENPDSGPNGVGVQIDHAYTLEARAEVQAVAFSIMPMNSGTDYKARETAVAQPVMAAGPAGGNQGGDYIVQPIAFDTTQMTSKANRSNPKAGDPCHPLTASGDAPAIAFAMRGREEGAVPEVHEDGSVVSALRAASGGSTRDMVAFQVSESGVRVDDVHATLDANNGSRRHNGTFSTSAVRRLTPLECSRLQAFPDDFARIPWGGRPAEECPDGPQYKAYGNSMAINCMAWLGERIQLVEDIINGEGAGVHEEDDVVL